MGVRGVTIVMMSLTLAGLAAGCATHPSRANRDNVANTADRLEQDSDLLARDAAAPPANGSPANGDYVSGFARDTHQLAIDDEVDHSDAPAAQRDFHPAVGIGDIEELHT